MYAMICILRVSMIVGLSSGMRVGHGVVQRRSVLSQGIGTGLSISLFPELARAETIVKREVEFGVDGTGSKIAKASFEVPEAWQVSDTRQVSSGGRRLVVYADQQNADTNAFLLITPVRGDYTGLGSFGTIESVQDTIIPRGPDIDSEIIDATKGAARYTFEYTVTVPDQPKRHLTTIFMLEADSIVSFNVQARDQDYSPETAATLTAITKSFKVSKL